MEKVNTQITTAKSAASIREWLNSDTLKNQISQALPAICKPERFMRTIATAIQKTPKLMTCSQASLFQAFMTCSELGIEPDGRRAHLIPYGNTCQLIIDYKGIVELVKRNGDVSTIRVEKVCENDKFKWTDGEIKHSIDFKKARGDAYAYYAVVKFKDGSTQSAVMNKDEIESVRKRSRASSSGPWITDYDEMAKKTVFRRLSKMLVLSPELHVALEASDRAEFSAEGQEVVDTKPTAQGVLAAALELPKDDQLTADSQQAEANTDTVKNEGTIRADREA